MAHLLLPIIQKKPHDRMVHHQNLSKLSTSKLLKTSSYMLIKPVSEIRFCGYTETRYACGQDSGLGYSRWTMTKEAITSKSKVLYVQLHSGKAGGWRQRTEKWLFQ